jgi:hypothetical protein
VKATHFNIVKEKYNDPFVVPYIIKNTSEYVEFGFAVKYK